MRALALLVVASLLAVSALAFVAVAPPVQAATTDVSGQLITSAGPTTAFGGGDYRFIEFGNDAAFGVVWGNATHANNIYVVAIKARYLGVGQVYNNATHALVDTNEPIKVYTIYASQIQDIVEYKDATGDGAANYTRTYNATTKSWSNYAFTGDTGYKLVNLSANWVPGTVTNTSGTGYKGWSFNLTATNLAYYNISSKAKLTGALPLVRFTFHLNASAVQVDNVSVPQWNVTVDQVLGHYTLQNVVQMNDLTLKSVQTIHYDLKWDQLIQGWSYANQNPAGMRRLLLETGSIVVNYIPSTVLAGWHLVHSLGDDGQAQYNSTAGAETADNSTGAYTAPHVFKSPNLDFGGDWTRIAKLDWTTNSTVDNVTHPLVAQIAGGFGFGYLDAKGLWYGFVLLVGFNYVGGNQIVHDPSVSADATAGVTFQTTTPPGTGPAPAPAGYGALVIGIVLLVVLVLVAYAMIVRGRKKEEPPAQPPMQPPQPPQS